MSAANEHDLREENERLRHAIREIAELHPDVAGPCLDGCDPWFYPDSCLASFVASILEDPR